MSRGYVISPRAPPIWTKLPIVGNYAIYYRLLEDDARVEIVRMVHAARDVGEMF